VTELDGLDIHFIHVRSKHENALPMIVTHGWPGSIIEELNIIDPLTNPTAHGASASDAFHLVIPSMPGFGFSAKPTSGGWDPPQMARAWVTLMTRLGYTQFVSSGGDWGSLVSNSMAEQAHPELLGIHVNLPATIPPDIMAAILRGDAPNSDLSADEKSAYEQVAEFFTKHGAYASMMATSPQTLYGLADSPIGLAAWILNGHPPNELNFLKSDHTRDEMLDNITLYWFTNTAISSARLYWENKRRLFISAVNISVPAAVSVFPGEIYQAPRSWTERAYRNLIHYNRVDKGGHFAGWDQPKIFSAELRAAFRSLRK